MTHLHRLTFLCYISQSDCLTAEIHEKCRVFNAFRGLGFFRGGGVLLSVGSFCLFCFVFFSHKDLVDFQPNKIVDTMNYMCLANWQTY